MRYLFYAVTFACSVVIVTLAVNRGDTGFIIAGSALSAYWATRALDRWLYTA